MCCGCTALSFYRCAESAVFHVYFCIFLRVQIARHSLHRIRNGIYKVLENILKQDKSKKPSMSDFNKV